MTTEASTYAEFAELAKLYCALIEDPSVKGSAGLSAIRSSLLTLYTAALQLPPMKSTDLERSMEHSDWQEIYESLQTRLPINLYWKVFDPLDETKKEVTVGSLADDMADVWRDLSVGLRELSLNPANQQAVWWEWHFGFEVHWGRHAIGALTAMHYALQDND